MPKFDTEKDALLGILGTVTAEDAIGDPIVAELRSYNDGDPKLALIRKGTYKKGEKAGQDRFGRLGRMTQQEACNLRDLLICELDDGFEFAQDCLDEKLGS